MYYLLLYITVYPKEGRTLVRPSKNTIEV